jgi:hypothetical protein
MDGTYQFPQLMPTGASYDIELQQGRPVSPNQICTLSNNTGVIGTAPVTNVDVACLNAYSISVEVVDNCDSPSLDPPITLATATDNLNGSPNVTDTASADSNQLMLNAMQNYVADAPLPTTMIEGTTYTVTVQSGNGCFCEAYNPNPPPPALALTNAKARRAHAPGPRPVPLGLPPTVVFTGTMGTSNVQLDVICSCRGCG